MTLSPSKNRMLSMSRETFTGRIIFMVTPLGAFTLFELSRFLIEGDLDLYMALNLDGGASTGIALAEPAESVPAFSRLPAVIAVFPRS